MVQENIYKILRPVMAAGIVLFGIAGCGSGYQRYETPAETGTVMTEKAGETSGSESPELNANSGIEPVMRGELPTAYDAGSEGRIAPVRDQGESGTCWAFASLSALESRLLPDESCDFSEDHMSHNPNFLLGQTGGGEYTMAMAYLLSWQGPVTEAMDPYGDGSSPDGLEAVKHVQEIRILPDGDRDAVKRAILRWGGVESSLYSSLKNGYERSEAYNPETAAYCWPEVTEPNHDVVIVGWDDDFPKEAFSTEVQNDGAFLCENSWGDDFGENGFFYVSYEDANIGRNNIVYSGVEDTKHWTKIWQSDLCGWVGQLGYGEESAWAANVYAVDAASTVGAAGFYATMQDTDYEVYFVENIPEHPGDRELTQRVKVAEGHLDYAGYYTVPFAKEYEVQAGERFAVEIRLTTPGAVHPIAIEYDAGDGKCAIDLSDGEGYASADGRSWERVEDGQKCNVCLKAYGR